MTDGANVAFEFDGTTPAVYGTPTPIAEIGGNGLDGLVQYAATSAISFVEQSGSAAIIDF